MTSHKTSRLRAGYTLIELLVVIAIIAILAALITAGVQKVRIRGNDLQIRADVDQLTIALNNFKSKINIYPPDHGDGTMGTFRLCSNYTDAMGNYIMPFTAASREVVVLRQMFPRMNLADTGLRRAGVAPVAGNLASDGVPPTAPLLLDGNQSMVIFLSGGTFTNYTGLSTDPVQPFKSNGARLNNAPFFDFTPGRLVPPMTYRSELITEFNDGDRFTGDTANSRNEPWYVDTYKNPYLYFASNNGNDYFYTDALATPRPLTIGPWGGVKSKKANAMQGVFAFYSRATATGPVKYRNASTVQIISSGYDGLYGDGGNYAGGSNGYTELAPGGDDFANFAGQKLAAPNQ